MPIANDLQVTIEYDSRGKRATKHFEDVYAGKRFYIAKLNSGKSPAVVGQPTPEDWQPADPETEERNATIANAQGGDVGPATIALPVVAAAPAARLGVNPGAVTRALVAGKVLGRFGHANGVTEVMIQIVDAEFGKPNPVESGIHLRNAYHAIKGFFEANGMAIPAAAAEVAK